MSRTPSSAASAERDRVVRKLAATAALSVLLQALAFVALAWLERWCAQLLLDAVARLGQGTVAAGTDALVAGALVVLQLFTALVVGYIGARRLLRAIVRGTPHPMRPPTRPVAWAGLCAGGIAAAFSILIFASSGRSFAVLWYAWFFELVRDAAIIALFWYAATRVLAPKRSR